MAERTDQDHNSSGDTCGIGWSNDLDQSISNWVIAVTVFTYREKGV